MFHRHKKKSEGTRRRRQRLKWGKESQVKKTNKQKKNNKKPTPPREPPAGAAKQLSREYSHVSMLVSGCWPTGPAEYISTALTPYSWCTSIGSEHSMVMKANCWCIYTWEQKYVLLSFNIRYIMLHTLVTNKQDTMDKSAETKQADV